MHPVLFKIPLSERLVLWLPVILAILLAVYGVSRLVGKEKDRSGAVTSFVIAAALCGARFLWKGYPDLAKTGELPIYSYGVMLGLSLVVGWYLTLGLAERDGLPKETMANNYVVTAIAAVAGSRVLYILTNLSEFEVKDQATNAFNWGASFAAMFAMRKGGLVAYGGFLGGLAGSYFFLRRHKLPLLPWADVAVPSLASGLMITRIGCYMFGCDFGQPLKDSAPAILKKLGTFPHWAAKTLEAGEGSPAWVQHVKHRGLSPTAEYSLPVHPTQIYESMVGLLLLLLLLWARKRQQFRGQIFFLFAYAYGVARFLLEMLRDDEERGSIPPSLPEHVLLPICLAIFAIGWIIGFSKAIENATFQRLTHALAFVPAILVYLALRPTDFAEVVNNQLSTSQFIALSSGFAACVAFAVFYKAALAHPKQAMALNLPPEFLPEGAAPPPEPKPADTADDDDEEEERVPVKKPAKKKAKVKAKAKQPKPAAEATEKSEDNDDASDKAKASADASDKDDAKDQDAS